ncbi:hypothetical protein [Chryseobacterium lathyri]|uniref:hypothetical protein n=1 Tax=Chryseobacterium lathyri TaxID=395933 RepID=UPI0027868F1E|nr:hypothetical protein [Chryseobacterium lathyri]MDQ0068065.1 hypothetical protein [Chryseobacterium lathyri]
MKKNFIFRLLSLIAVAIGLQSCRTSEDYLSGNEEPSYSKKFQVFSSANKEPVNYAQGFKTLLEHYDQINGTSYTRASLLKKGNFNKDNSEYVEFSLYSQEMLLDDGERWVVYPIIKNSQVDGLMVGILRNEETEVEFRKLDSGSSYYAEVIEIFRTAFMKSNLKKGVLSKGSGCGFEGQEPCDVGEIVIPPPPKPRPTGGGTQGGCTGYNNCFDPSVGSGGGGSAGQGSEDPTPCWRMQLKTNNETFKNNITNLEGKTGESFESGFRIGSGGENQILQNNLGSQTVNMTRFPNTVAIMHSHYDGLYPIFSPGDIIYFNEWIVWAQNYNSNPANSPKIPLNQIVFTVVSSWGNYSFMFDGTSSTPFPNFTEQQLLDFNDYYIKVLDEAKSVGNVSGNISYNMEQLEKGFLKFMTEKMNMSGASLFRNTSSGNTQLSLVNGKLTETNCP